MKRLISATIVAIICTTPALAQIETPERPVTDPQKVQSPVDPNARVVPIGDISASSNLSSAAWSKDGKQIFITTNLTGRYNIWRTDTSGSWPVRLTQSDEAQTGLAVSHDGKYVYFEQDVGGNEYADIYRVPVNGGAVENLTNSPTRGEGGMLVRPRDGLIALVTKLKTEGQSNIALMDSKGNVRMLTEETDPQFSWFPVAWTDDGKSLVANRINVDRTVGEIFLIDVDADIQLRWKLLDWRDTFFEATDISPDGEMILINTNDNGQMRAGLYIWRQKALMGIPSTPWEQRGGKFTNDGKSIIFGINADARSTLYTLDIATNTETALAIPQGFNSLIGSEPISPDGTQMMIYRSGADTPGNLYLYDMTTEKSRPVTQLAIASLLPDALPKSEIITYKSFDDTLISAIVTMPANLKRDGSNPAIVFPHGGPTSQAKDGYSRHATAFASRGYIVIQPNFRGSTGYGKAFQTANAKDLGGGDLKDTVAAKHFLVKTGYVDPERVGIFGGSYGGFMTLMAIGREPDEFAAAVQWFGIINWRTMYRDQDEFLKAYQRSLLGTPEENPDIYDAASPLTYIQAATAPLLTIQGENDIRVPKGQAQEVHDILKAKGNIVETIYYPNEGHGFRKRENQIDSLARTVEWFDKYLKTETDK